MIGKIQTLVASIAWSFATAFNVVYMDYSSIVLQKPLCHESIAEVSTFLWQCQHHVVENVKRPLHTLIVSPLPSLRCYVPMLFQWHFDLFVLLSIETLSSSHPKCPQVRRNPPGIFHITA